MDFGNLGIGVNMACVEFSANAFSVDFIFSAVAQKNIFHTGGNIIFLFCVLVYAVNFGRGSNFLMVKKCYR